MGCFRAVSSLYVRRTCTMFWLYLFLYIAISAFGVAALIRRASDNGQASPYSEGTEYDWSVSGKEGVVNGDRVRTAYRAVNNDGDYPSVADGRRLLATSEDGARLLSPRSHSAINKYVQTACRARALTLRVCVCAYTRDR